MKTTLELPDDLMRTIKLRAVREDRTLKDLIAELLRRGLVGGRTRPPAALNRVRVPLVRCAHGAGPAEEMLPERVAEVLNDEEARGAAPR
jgi:plasmid stability protein